MAEILSDSELEGMSEEGLEKLEELVKAQMEMERERNGLSRFVPNVPQERVIKAMGEEGKVWIYVVPSGNGVGKTAVALNVLGNLVWGPQSEWFVGGERYEKWKYPKQFWYVSEKATLRDVIVGTGDMGEKELQKFFPKWRYSLSKGGYEYWSQFESDTGWSGVFKTFDMDVTQFESGTIGVAIFDEPPPEVLFNATVARFRQGGVILIVMTPLQHSAWAYDRLLQSPSDDTWILVADIEEVCKQHSVRGHLDHDVIERMCARYSEEEREARVSGKFIHLAGIVYKKLNANTHFRSPVNEGWWNQEKNTIYMVVDPHDVKPPVVGWFSVEKSTKRMRMLAEWPPLDEYGKYHEIRSFSMRTEDTVALLADLERTWKLDPRMIVRIMDPNYGEAGSNDVGDVTAEVWRKIGRELKWPMRFHTDVVDDITEGHRAVRDLLLPNADGRPQLEICLSCPQMWYQLTHYTHDPRTGRGLEKHGPGDRVQQKFKDFPDIMRYFAMFVGGRVRISGKKAEVVEEIPEHYAMYGPVGKAPKGAVDWRDPHRV